MSKRTKVLATVMAAMTLTTAFMGCGSKGSDSSKGEKTLTVWSHLKTAEVNKLREKAEKWGEENNVKVTVQEDTAEMQDAITALQSSKGPDLYYGLANDNLGTYQKAGVLAEVKSGFINESDYTRKNVINAVTIDNKQYAVPIAQECLALFYNKDKVAEAPKTMEEAINIGKEKGFMFNASDFYITFGFVSANGGYVFKDNDGSLDTDDIGLANAGAIKGFETLKKFVDDKLIAADITDDIAKGNFTDGKTALYISGPWSVADCKAVNLGIAELPTIDGQPMKPFLGVQTAFVSAKSDQDKQDLAWDLLKYLNKEMPDDLLTEGNRLPVLKSAQESDVYKSNEYMKVFSKQAEIAIPMPNVREVQCMWTPAANNLKALLNGSQDAKTSAEKTVEQIKEGIKQQ